MDLDNLSPLILFIIYMAISGWSKQKKARQRSQPVESPDSSESNSPSGAMQEVGGILEQLKKELFEIDEDPLSFQQAAPEILDEYDEAMVMGEAEVMPEATPEDVLTPQFSEGSPSHGHEHPPIKLVELEELDGRGQSLEEVLAPYSRLEQGIILGEILGKPRARQENDDWFHRS